MSKKIKVLHLSTHFEDCGVGKYQEQFLEQMEHTKFDEIENKFFPYSPNQTKLMPEDGLSKVVDELRAELRNYDVLHVQHEFSFYHHREFARFCAVANELGKTLIVTYHTSPAFVIKEANLPGLSPRSILHFLRTLKYKKKMVRNHIEPAFKADAVIAHNQVTEDALIHFGVPAAKLVRLQLPVPEVKEYTEVSTEIAQGLNKKPGDVIYCSVGFMHRFKGLYDAVKALRFLPDNHKLAIIGGLNPQSDEVEIYNSITDMILKYGLEDRVYITGFVKDDDRLNRLIRECDICIYPYDKNYYAGVSSASLNIAFSNIRPVVAYPVQTFIGIAEESQAILLSNGFSYYELARSIRSANIDELTKRSRAYAKAKSYTVVTHDLVGIYEKFTA